MSAAEFTANYLIDACKKTHGKRWQGSRDKDLRLFGGCRLRGISYRAHVAVTKWDQGVYPITLIDFVPTPRQMLEYQCQGRRYVSIVSQLQLNKNKIERTPLEFTVHDLEHADKFFSDPELHVRQIAFFECMDRLDESGLLKAISFKDKQFAKDYNYVLSDMNSHPAHMHQFLKATLLQAFLRKEKKNPKDKLSEKGRKNFDLLFSKVDKFFSDKLEILELINPQPLVSLQ